MNKEEERDWVGKTDEEQAIEPKRISGGDPRGERDEPRTLRRPLEDPRPVVPRHPRHET